MLYKLTKKGHTERNQNEESKRQTNIEKHSGSKFFYRINPDAECFDIFLEISKLQNYIIQSNKEKLKKEKEVKTKKLKDKFKKLEAQIKEYKMRKNKKKLNN